MMSFIAFSDKWHSVINRREQPDTLINRALRTTDWSVTENADVSKVDSRQSQIAFDTYREYPQLGQRDGPRSLVSHSIVVSPEESSKTREKPRFYWLPTIATARICAWIVPGRRTFDPRCEQQLNRRSVHAKWQHHAGRATAGPGRLGVQMERTWRRWQAQAPQNGRRIGQPVCRQVGGVSCHQCPPQRRQYG